MPLDRITSSLKLSRNKVHSKPPSKTFTPQNSIADIRLHGEIERPDHQPLPSESRTIEQSIGTALQDAHHFSIGGNARIVTIGQQNVNNQGGPSGLDSLEKFVSFSALHDSSAQDPERCCHPGTRENVLHQIRNWVDDPNRPEHILWLHGPAGVGKSAIAQTISNSYGRDKVGATFFSFRSDPVRNDGNRLFSTLAWQLALSVPTVKDLIVSSLEDYPDLPTKAIETQFDKLITHPFLAISGDESSRVVIIDGLDECSDVKLQQRILKIIGNAVSDPHFPLRFIVCSRTEAHIEDFFSHFQYPTLQIDLANVYAAYRDIKTYLISKFARIAIQQDLDPEEWPGQGIIDTLVFKSSGQFVYASTVIKAVGAEYESAVEQLKIILGLNSSTGTSLFAELDALYTEILQRQPDKSFLKEFLSVLVARSMLTGDEHKSLHEDDAMLLCLDLKTLCRKLRGMHSLLKFKPFIDIHHKSFLDFLDDLSRSGEYHISKHFANRRYLQLITDKLVSAASIAIEQTHSTFRHSNHLCNPSHKGDHIKPIFATIIEYFPLAIKLPLEDLEDILQPLLTIQDKVLQLPNISFSWRPRACEECWTFYMIDDLLLHLTLLRGTVQSPDPKYVSLRPLTAIEESRSIPHLSLDACIALLLPDLRGVEVSPNVRMIGLIRALVRFDPTETAMRIRSITDAENLIELIFCLNQNQCFKSWFGEAAHNATRLALALYGRVPRLPRSIFLNGADLDMGKRTYQGKSCMIRSGTGSIRKACFSSFLWGNLSHAIIAPFLGISSNLHFIWQKPKNDRLYEWRRRTNPSVSNLQRIFFELAKALEFVHSLCITFCPNHFARLFNDSIYVDSDNHVQVRFLISHPNGLCKGEMDYSCMCFSTTLEDSVNMFGTIVYRVLFSRPSGEVTIEMRPEKPEIPDNVWRLIQWCCSKDPKKRPTMVQVVQEMECWISLGQFTLSS